MLNMILSVFVGVLAEKIVDANSKTSKYKTVTYIIGAILMVLFFLLCDACAKAYPNVWIVQIIKNIVGDYEKNAFIQGFLLFIVIIAIICCNYKELGTLPFKKYSKQIYDFTEKACEGSEIALIAGDMDFFGNVSVEEGDTENSLEQNPEYKQLVAKKDWIKLKILCNNKLTNQQVQSIADNTVNYKYFYDSFEAERNLQSLSFQQLLRIGKIKSDFGKSVNFYFYDEDNEDKQLRARFIDDEAIVYRKERREKRINLKKLFSKSEEHKTLWERIKSCNDYEQLYSISRVNQSEYQYYWDWFDLKCGSSDAKRMENNEKIVNFCESLYHYACDDEIRYKMALIYVNSYEIARKGEKRKEFPPFGVLYLAAEVRTLRNWKVELIAVDENTKNDDLMWRDYDVIGLSITSSYSYGILKKCYNACSKKKNVITIVGGYQAEKFANEVFRDFNADIIFKGEGEEAIKQFCELYRKRDFSSIQGIIYRDSDNQIQSTPGRGIVDIDKISEPARDLLDTDDVVMYDRLAGTNKKMVHMLFSRGCPHECYYCAANQDGNNRNIRYRDKRLIVKELQNLKEEYQIQGFSIIDDSFLSDKGKALDICRFIAESDLQLDWSLAARVDSINEEVLEVLKRAGCIEIKFGIETGSDLLLQEMNKGITASMTEQTLRKTKEYGIRTKIFIITGLPGETDETHEETKKFLQKLQDDNLIDRISLLRYTPLAGSYIYTNPEKYGINRKMLNIKYFDKVRLYRKTHDWWMEKRQMDKRNVWYEDMRKFIDERWSED